MIRIAVILATLISLALQGWVPASAQSDYQGDPYSISLGPTNQTASAGQYVDYYVTVSSPYGSFSGYVLVVIPEGLAISSQPECSTGCGQPDVTPSNSGTQIETSIRINQEEQATFSFQISVPIDVSPGSSYELIAYLLGGVNTAGSSETSFASLFITAPTILPTSPSMPDNRTASLVVSPSFVHIAPGGKVWSDPLKANHPQSQLF